MIGLVNYGLGNIKALKNIYKKLNVSCKFINNPIDIEKVEKIILPGVGSFDNAIEKLKESNLLEVINYKVKIEKMPVLGICVGMQMMANKSEEGVLDGLGWITGKVKKFKQSSFSTKPFTPHMGWNNVEKLNNSIIFNGIEHPKFYFLHSYYLEPEDSSIITSTTNYGFDFCSSINHENIYATQFHPEKSHNFGVKMLENFSKL